MWSEEQSPDHSSSAQVLCFQNNPCCPPLDASGSKTTGWRGKRGGRHDYWSWDVAVSKRKVIPKRTNRARQSQPPECENSPWKPESRGFGQETTNWCHRDTHSDIKRGTFTRAVSLLHPSPFPVCAHQAGPPTHRRRPRMGSSKHPGPRASLSLCLSVWLCSLCRQISSQVPVLPFLFLIRQLHCWMSWLDRGFYHSQVNAFRVG